MLADPGINVNMGGFDNTPIIRFAQPPPNARGVDGQHQRLVARLPAPLSAAGRRQGLPVHLAVRSERQGCERHEGGGHHVVGQPLAQGLAQRMHRFSWVNEWKEIVRADGQPAGVELVLPDWFYHGVLTESLVLSIDPRYFRLTGGIERWLYRVVRKHGGRQRAGWRFDLPYLYAKSGSQARFTDFAGDVRRVAQRQALPGYRLQVARVGEMEWLIFQRERIAFAE